MEQKNSNAVAGLVLGIISVAFSLTWAVGIFTLIIGLATGIIGIVLSVKGRKIPVKKGMATAGLVLSIIGTCLSGIMCVCVACVIGTGAAIVGLNSASY